MKPQVLAIYYHKERNLFFVSSINEDRIETEGRIEKQYSRARSLHKGIKRGTVNEHGSGFLYALINTDFQGWEVIVCNGVYTEQSEAIAAKQDKINNWLEDNWTNVGSNNARSKGEYGKGTTEYNWNKKFNVGRMTRADIDEKIKFLLVGSELPIDNTIRNAVYYAIVLPDSHGPKNKNFGNYQVDSLSNIFLFVRQLCGLDLD